MSDQARIDYQLPDAGTFGGLSDQGMGHSDSITMNDFIMSPISQDSPAGQLSNTQFIDFQYPFQELENGIAPPGPQGQGELYNGSTRGAISERRASIISVTGGRQSFSGILPLAMPQNGSVEGGGSDGPSPDNVIVRRQSIIECFGEDSHSNGNGTDANDPGKVGQDGNTPAWSELKTKAGKERKRLPLACIACRRKKIRCSGEKPACKHCLRSRIPCVYKVTARKAAPRTDYMAMLDKRLKRMEDRIIKIVPKEEQDFATIIRAQVKPAIPGTIPIRSTINRKRVAEEAFGAELDSWSKGGSANPRGPPGWPPHVLKQQENEESRLLTEGAEALPSQEIQEHLSEVFFDNLYGQAYHLLHKPSFMRKLKAGTVPPVLILAVCGISARFSTHPQLDSKPAFLRGDEWAKEARDIVMRRYDWPNITILTCLLLLGLHEFGTCHGGRSWALGGMAIRMAFALQLHKNLEYDPLVKNPQTRLSFVDREIRRRTMWSCFLMDRFNSSGTDRPISIREETIEIPLPVAEKLFQLDMEGVTETLHGTALPGLGSEESQTTDAKSNMGVAAYIIRAIAIHGKNTAYLAQGGRHRDSQPPWRPDSVFATLVKDAERFRNTLPEFLQYSQENLDIHDTSGLANQFLFLHVVTEYNIMSPYHHIQKRDAPIEFVSKACKNAMDAAVRISDIIRDSENHTVTAPFSGHCAVVSSTVQMPAAFNINPKIRQQAEKNLAINIRFIAKMKRFWGTFHYYSEHLRNQYKWYADAVHTSDSTEAPVFQYGDWFERYPHGVSQSDFEDPAANLKKEKGDDAVLEAKSDLHTVEDFLFTSLTSAQRAEQSKKRTKSNAKKPVSAQLQPPPPTSVPNTQPQPTPPPMIHPGIPQGSAQQYQHMTQASGRLFLPPDAASHHQYQPGPGHSIGFPHQQPPMLPQLDRQLVFGAYDNGAAVHLQDHDLNFLDMSMMNHGGLGNGTEDGFLESSAWFMPFNMEPPPSMPGAEDDFLMNFNMNYGMQSTNDPQHGMGGSSAM